MILPIIELLERPGIWIGSLTDYRTLELISLHESVEPGDDRVAEIRHLFVCELQLFKLIQGDGLVRIEDIRFPGFGFGRVLLNVVESQQDLAVFLGD